MIKLKEILTEQIYTLYHGGKIGITSFKQLGDINYTPSQSDTLSGIYLCGRQDDAVNYMKRAISKKFYNKDSKNIFWKPNQEQLDYADVYEVTVDIKNPFFTNATKNKYFTDFMRLKQDEIINLKKDGYDAVVWGNSKTNSKDWTEVIIFDNNVIKSIKSIKNDLLKQNKIKLKEISDQRTDISPKETVILAINDIRKLGVKHIFTNDTVIDNNVLVDVSFFDGYLHLSSIMSVDKGKGDATKVMNKICKIADKYKVTIDLEPTPFGTGKILNTQQLTNWYKKFGFKMGKYGDMKRNPMENL